MFLSPWKVSCLACGVLLSLAAGVHAQNKAVPPFALHNGDRVVFYGDSITDQRLYTTFVENYVVTRFPHLQVSFVHSGWGGDRVNGGAGGPIDVRLTRDVFAYNPTVMTIMLGMNDGNFHSFDQGAFDIYSQGYDHILDAVQKTAPGIRLTLIKPSPYDDVTQAPNVDGGYNSVLIRYGQFVADLAAKNHAGVADFNTPVVAMLQKANTADHATAQKIIPDRGHPSPGGHLVMAQALLKSWNAPALVTSVRIDAVHRRVMRADNSQVSGLAMSGKALQWTQLDGALPLPVVWDDPVIALVRKSSDVIEALDQELLQVDGLTPAAHYSLRIDDQEVGAFSGAQLAAGINLAPMTTPMAAQAAKVAALTTRHNDQHFTRWRTIQVPLGGDANSDAVQKAASLLLTALDAEESDTVAQQRAAAQPAPHHYKLVPRL